MANQPPQNDENSNKRRDRHDIVTEILKTARYGKIKTHIMYKAKLSYAQINEYLLVLLEKGFLKENTIKQRRQVITMYQTTNKGHEYLSEIEKINKLWIQP